MFSRTNFIHRSIGGFSLIEVLITAAIVGIVTAIVVVRYGAFNSSVLLSNQAYEVALSIREAQVNSVSIRGGSSANFRDAYGIYIGSLPTQQYTLFLDDLENGNVGEYDSGEEIETLTLDSRFEIYEFCLGSSKGDGCTQDGSKTFSVTFRRPDFDAIMTTSDVSVGDIGAIKIRPASRGTGTRAVNIQSTGLISVE